MIADTHIGQDDSVSSETLTDLLQSIADEFQAQDVDMVVHLGDIAYEDPLMLYESRVEKAGAFFDWAEYIPMLGNHDAEVVSVDEFEMQFDTSVNQIVYEDGETAVLALNSTGTGSFTGYGHLDDEAIELLTEAVEAYEEVLVFTHYPLQYTDYYHERPVFDTHPEYTFPINKGLLTDVFDSASCDVSFYCGHLHPSETVTVETEPFGYPLTIVEPIQSFSQLNSGEIVWEANESIDVSALILSV